eukprot:scaffold293131_cov50-Prasinocladus_malaysianus.AAC.1
MSTQQNPRQLCAYYELPIPLPISSGKYNNSLKSIFGPQKTLRIHVLKCDPGAKIINELA